MILGSAQILKVLSVISIIYLLSIEEALGQLGSDTLYILFEKNEMTSMKRSSKKHPDEYDYPQDWGRSYRFHKGDDEYANFYYYNHPPEWIQKQLEYKIIKNSFIENHDFKDYEY